MYNRVYIEMVSTGIAETHEQPEYFDMDNNNVEIYTEEQVVGTKSKVDGD
jgi:hypothetical protein